MNNKDIKTMNDYFKQMYSDQTSEIFKTHYDSYWGNFLKPHIKIKVGKKKGKKYTKHEALIGKNRIAVFYE